MFRVVYSERARAAKAPHQHYHCSACGGVFKFFHKGTDDPPPDCCQLCGAVLNDEVEPIFVPKAPGIRKNLLVKSENQVYRQMEASSIARAEEARSTYGLSAEEASPIKITNMREAGEMREGDTAAIMPATNQVAQLMQQHPTQAGGFNNLAQQPGSQYALGHADAGAATLGRIMPQHSQIAGRLVNAGRMNR